MACQPAVFCSCSDLPHQSLPRAVVLLSGRESVRPETARPARRIESSPFSPRLHLHLHLHHHHDDAGDVGGLPERRGGG